ncbi:MAG: type II toxin-antitoxin system VapC family toxin [Tardiphaga sp.]
MTLVDTNVVIDVLLGDPQWFAWSSVLLKLRSDRGPIFVNDIVYAELAARFDHETSLDQALATMDLTLHRLPKPALFLAGQAFRRYRNAGGPRTSLIADFIIGAHAAAAHIPLLTRDPRRYQTYFPDVELIAPS